jgi:XTP/dITP diphosphohydrolase
VTRAIERLVVASGNPHKVQEIRAELERVASGVVVLGLDHFEGSPEVEESADTFVGNAVIKATATASWLAERGEPGATFVLADDSGICVEALGGAPGVRSARFAGAHATDPQNNGRLVQALQARGLERSPAHYVCVLALVRVDRLALDAGRQDGAAVFEGRWDVEVRTQARGTGGFGYDPHAWLDGARTVAELSPPEKAAISHRGVALRKLADWLTARPRE